MIPNCKTIGSLEKPLAGLVLHFGTGGDNCLPCEAAWLAKSKYRGVQVPPAKVYVSRSVLNRMRRIYKPLGENVIVEPLLFTEDELDAQAFLSMMAVESSDSAPLYMQVFLVRKPDLHIQTTVIYNVTEHSQRAGGGLHIRKVPGETGGPMRRIQQDPTDAFRPTDGSVEAFHEHRAPCAASVCPWPVDHCGPVGPVHRSEIRLWVVRDNHPDLHKGGSRESWQSPTCGRSSQSTLLMVWTGHGQLTSPSVSVGERRTHRGSFVPLEADETLRHAGHH